MADTPSSNVDDGRTDLLDPPMTTAAANELRRLGQDFFNLQNTVDPLSATMLGITGYDHLLPDFSRAASERSAAAFAKIEDAVRSLNLDELDEAQRTNALVLERLAWGARADIESDIWETNAGSEGYATPASMIFMCVPAAGVAHEAAAKNYLTRLSGISEVFDAITERYQCALRDGRYSTRAGIERLLEQLRGHVETPIEVDLLANPPWGDVNVSTISQQSREVVETRVRPAISRLINVLEGPLLNHARDDEHVGLCHLPGGARAYALAVRRHTTTELSPEEIHSVGLDHLDRLAEEWAELGLRTLGISDVGEITRRLRSDPSLRCRDASEIIFTVTAALNRAEFHLSRWFPPFDIAPCIVEEINPVEAKSAALAHYRPPAGDGSRPGAHCVLTLDPASRFLYEYEALAFHESVPGHHLQIATAQAMTSLPEYRRYLDVQVCAFVEGWGLYSERLADEMGLYSSDIARLGMLSFDALRACRLVVDTGMHALGWSRQRAIDFMWSHTATTMSNVTNEIDRYITWPGQALAYMTGRLEIERLREWAAQSLGAHFDIREFHELVLSDGAVPLGILARNVTRWVEGIQEREK